MTEPADPPLAGLAELAGKIAQILQAGDDPAARSAIASSVDQLRARIARGGAPGLDPAQLGDALAAFAEWLRAPSPEREARAERAMSELQAVLGPGLGVDPARQDADRRAEYRRQARAALDDIFPDKPKR